MPSNREIGKQNLMKLKRWLDAADSIPERNGKANISAISVASGLDRQVLYRPEAKAMIQQAVTRIGLRMPEQARVGADEVPSWASRKIHQLEQRLAAAQVENNELRKRLRSYAAIESFMQETGQIPR